MPYKSSKKGYSGLRIRNRVFLRVGSGSKSGRFRWVGSGSELGVSWRSDLARFVFLECWNRIRVNSIRIRYLQWSLSIYQLHLVTTVYSFISDRCNITSIQPWNNKKYTKIYLLYILRTVASSSFLIGDYFTFNCWSMQIKASINITQSQIKNLMGCNTTLWINRTMLIKLHNYNHFKIIL